MKEQRKIGSKGNIMAYDCKDYYGLQIKKFKYSFLDTETMTHPRYSEQFWVNVFLDILISVVIARCT